MSKRPKIKGRGADIYLGGSDTKQPSKPTLMTSQNAAVIKQAKSDSSDTPDAPFDQSFCGIARMKQAAAWYIDTNEKLARQAVELQKKNVEWATGTAFAPLFEAQASSACTLIEGSAATARNLWRIRN